MPWEVSGGSVKRSLWLILQESAAVWCGRLKDGPSHVGLQEGLWHISAPNCPWVEVGVFSYEGGEWCPISLWQWAKVSAQAYSVQRLGLLGRVWPAELRGCRVCHSLVALQLLHSSFPHTYPCPHSLLPSTFRASQPLFAPYLLQSSAHTPCLDP